jgi:hypothetical protein
VRLVFVRYGLDGRHGGWLREFCGVARNCPVRLSVIDAGRGGTGEFR